MLDVAATIDALVDRPSDTVLLCDFDGSLAPIVDLPDEAVALPAALAVLEVLVGQLGRVAIVSGRPVKFLARRLPVPGLAFSGLYGMERLVDGHRQVDPRAVPFAKAVASAADEAEARLPGVLVERKDGVSFTLHWRTAPDRAEEVLDAASELSRRYGLAEWHSRFAVELRPPVAIDKGTVIDDLIEGFGVAAFAGDDTGDLAGFAALGRAAADGRLTRAVRIGVESPEMPDALPGAVDVLVAGPAGLVELLGAVARRLAP